MSHVKAVLLREQKKKNIVSFSTGIKTPRQQYNLDESYVGQKKEKTGNVSILGSFCKFVNVWDIGESKTCPQSKSSSLEFLGRDLCGNISDEAE